MISVLFIYLTLRRTEGEKAKRCLVLHFKSSGFLKKYELEINQCFEDTLKTDEVCDPAIKENRRKTALKIDASKLRFCVRENFKSNFLDQLTLKYFLEEKRSNAVFNHSFEEKCRLSSNIMEDVLTQAQENCARLENNSFTFN